MDFERVNIKGGSAYENVAGYSRIVKAGPFVYVSGTTSVTPEGTVYGEGDPYEQAKMFTFTTSSRETPFSSSRPCCTWIGIKELNRPTQLVEIEMQAIVGAKA